MCFFRFKERKNMLIQHCYISISVSCNLWSSLMECPEGHLSATKLSWKMHYDSIFFPEKKVSIHFHPYKLKTAAAHHWGFNCTTKAEFSACWVLVIALPVCPSAETLNWGLICLPLGAAVVEWKISLCFSERGGATSESWPSFSKHVTHKARGKSLLHNWSCQLDFQELWKNLQNQNNEFKFHFIIFWTCKTLRNLFLFYFLML